MIVDPTHHVHMFRSAPEHLFRGARLNGDYESEYSGSGETPTSIDPIVATLFAPYQRSKGKAFVLILEKGQFRERLGGPSLRKYSGIELAVNLALPPMEVQKLATKTLPIEISLAILKDMGFPLIEKLFGITQLQDALGDEKRLIPQQIEEYSRRALEVKL